MKAKIEIWVCHENNDAENRELTSQIAKWLEIDNEGGHRWIHLQFVREKRLSRRGNIFMNKFVLICIN